MGVSSSESHDLTAFYEMLSASFGVLSQNTGFYPSLDRIIETTLGPLNLGPGGRSYNEPISRLQRLDIQYTTSIALVWVQYRFMDRALIGMQCIRGKAGVRMLLWYNVPRKGSHTGGNKTARETEKAIRKKFIFIQYTLMRMGMKSRMSAGTWRPRPQEHASYH